MKIALLGYGKMGKAVDQIALQRDHDVVARSLEEFEIADVCIDFSHPDAVLRHIGQACEVGADLVIGTTGWEDHMEAAKNLIADSGIGAIYSPNFSLGNHLFRNLLRDATELFRHVDGYDVGGYEIHHRLKEDAPSGTAMAIAEENQMEPFSSVRCGSIPGTHTVLFDSPYDTIELTLRARNRDGWALGAIQAAEWVHGKKGFFTIDDMLGAAV